MRSMIPLFFGLWASVLAAADADIERALTEDPTPDPEHPPAIRELAFESGGARLPGLLYLANGAGPHPTFVLLHGLPGNEKNLDLAQALRRAGFNVMFFHYRGAWGAEGDYRLNGLADDVATAVDFLHDNAATYRVDTDRISLVGHSLGGFTSLAAGSRIPGLACVAALAPANFGQMAEGIRSGEPGSLAFLDYADSLFMLHNFDGAVMRKELLETPASKLDTRLFGPGLAGKSVLLVTGDRDAVLPPAAIFDPVVKAYRDQDKLQLEVEVIPGDHSFSYSRLQLTRLLLGWSLENCR